MEGALTAAAVRGLLDSLVPRALAMADYFGDDLPDYYDVAAARWQANGYWTEGFWPGFLWQLYAHSGDSALRAAARRTTRIVADLKAQMDDHDLGFLFEPSCVHEHEFGGSDEMLPPAIAAARRLARRYLPRARYIPAHGPIEGPRAGFAIIDTIMNLPLMLWAAARTGESPLAAIANDTATTIAEKHVRADGSSWQVLWLDPASGAVLRCEAAMAASENSCWARGQAWGVQGFARMFRATGDIQFKATATRMARYFMARVPADGVVFHDLDDPAAPAVPRDTSAQAIAAGGLLLLAEAGTTMEHQRWRRDAERLLEPLVNRYLVNVAVASQTPRGVLSHGCKSFRKNQGIVSELVFGDYYFIAALRHWLRLTDGAA